MRDLPPTSLKYDLTHCLKSDITTDESHQKMKNSKNILEIKRKA